MCLEDIRIGRKIRVVEHFFSGQAANIYSIVDFSKLRVMLFFPACSNSLGAWLTIDPNPAPGKGIFIGSTMPGVVLDIKIHGQMVFKQWYIAPQHAMSLTWYEGILEIE